MFITGAAHGQGRATALAFAREGADVVAFDVCRPLEYPGYELGTSEDLESLAGECRALGVRCLPFTGDVRDDAGDEPAGLDPAMLPHAIAAGRAAEPSDDEPKPRRGRPRKKPLEGDAGEALESVS